MFIQNPIIVLAQPTRKTSASERWLKRGLSFSKSSKVDHRPDLIKSDVSLSMDWRTCRLIPSIPSIPLKTSGDQSRSDDVAHRTASLDC
jgi:hypothetical protein